MIAVRAPCPICGQPVKAPFKLGKGWWIGCTSDSHTVRLDRGKSAEEVAEMWDSLFLIDEAPVQ